MTKIKHEIRGLELPVAIETRDDTNEIKVSGYAAVFNERTMIGNWFAEQIAPGAFTRAVKEDDVRFLINHEGLPLARTASGTLTLKEDKKGLHMSATLDGEDPDVRSIVPKMERGDLDKMSFAFNVVIEEWDDSEDVSLRTIKEVELFDVAIVTYPAYEGTDIGLRSLQEFRDGRKTENFNAARRRVQAKMGMKLKHLEATK